MTNHYQLMELPDFADAAEIRGAYRRLAKMWHPDANHGSLYYEEKFKELQHAYSQLSDPLIKQRYDERLYRFLYPHAFPPEPEGDSGDGDTDNHGYEYYQSQSYQPPPPASPFAWLRKLVRPLVGISIYIAFKACLLSNERPSFTPANFTVTTYGGDYPKIGSPQSVLNDTTAKLTTDYFTMGSTQQQVMTIQGAPKSITQYPETGNMIWDYGAATVTLRDGLVTGYTNMDHSLRVKMFMLNLETAPAKRIAVGSSMADVHSVQGTPSSVVRYEDKDLEVWSYFLSFVSFKHGHVHELSNLGKNLKVEPILK